MMEIECFRTFPLLMHCPGGDTHVKLMNVAYVHGVHFNFCSLHAVVTKCPVTIDDEGFTCSVGVVSFVRRVCFCCYATRLPDPLIANAVLVPRKKLCININDLHVALAHSHADTLREKARQFGVKVVGELALDGKTIGMMKGEMKEEEPEEYEEQWLLTQQQQQQQLRSPEAPRPAWPPPPPAESENDYSDSGGRLRGEKGWLDGLVVKLNYESNVSCSVVASAAEPVDVLARAGVGTRRLVTVEKAGRHGHPAGEPFPIFGPD